MGCGRSSLSNDSPNQSEEKKEEKNSNDVVCEEEALTIPSSPVVTTKQPLIPFSIGGPLLAQAKISESQQDFFRSLDERIDNGPDYDSDEEEESRKARFSSYLRQWRKVIRSAAASKTSSASLSSDSRIFLRSCSEKFRQVENRQSNPECDHLYPRNEENSLSSQRTAFKTESLAETERNCDEEEEPKEVVEEKYMFMGSLYTLTRRPIDSKHKTKLMVRAQTIDVSSFPSEMPQVETCQVVTVSKMNGSSFFHDRKAAQTKNSVSKTDSSDTRSKSSSKSRPNSLALKTIVP